jgi:hypothetical protein
MLRVSFERHLNEATAPGGTWHSEQGTEECAPRCQLWYAAFIAWQLPQYEVDEVATTGTRRMMTITQMTAATATATNLRDLPRGSSAGCCGCWTSPSLTCESPSVCEVMVTGRPFEAARAGSSGAPEGSIVPQGVCE